ncbi:MAG: GNAT family N-acetyltransferase [Eubacterium sp.]
MINIKYVTPNDSEFLFVKEIRKTVFLDEQGADSEQEFDSFDNNEGSALFVLLYDENVPVATARLANTEKGLKLGRVAILKPYRGKGFGSIIVRMLVEKAFEIGADKVFVDAQTHAVPFYEKIGFKVTGTQITDRGLAHIPMSISRS